MKTRRKRIWAAAAVTAGFIVDMAFGHGLAVGPVRADLGFVCLTVVCLFVGANSGAALGLTLGILQASCGLFYAGSTMVSRTVTGWAVGALEERLFRDSGYVAVAMTFGGTLICELTFYACAPQPELRAFWTRALYNACGNGVLALPIYLLLRRPLVRDD